MATANPFVIFRRLLAPARPDGPISPLATIVTFALGAALACTSILAVAPFMVLVLLALLFAGLAALALSRFSLAVRAPALLVLVVFHFFWIYLLLSLGTVLAWTVPVPIRWLTALLAVAAVAGALAPRARFRLPTAVPFGIWIATCCIGWSRQDGEIRCDDYFAVRASAATLLVPTTEELERCQPGESLHIGHYPRRLWEDPEGGRLVMTTQHGINRFAPPGRKVPDRFPGTVCDVPLGGTPSCFGGGKAQGIVDAPERDRLFAAGWGMRLPGGQKGILYMLPRTAPLRPLREVHLMESVGELFYDPATDIVSLLSDEGEVLRPVRVSDGAILDAVPAPVTPGETHYDQSRDEGVFCFAAGPLRRLDGGGFLSVAFRARPFSIRPLGGARQNPSAWLSMVWGCDWDPETRRVYVADASLGMLAVLDYDSGQVLNRTWIGFGGRYVTLDQDRRLIYIANFMNGSVIALDLDTHAEVERWFAGRFIRHAKLSRDRASLFVTSNIGVLRFPLDQLDDREKASRE